MKNNNLIITILIVIIVAGGSFFAGMKYQQSKQPQFNRQANGGQGIMRNGQGNRQGFRPVSGDIISSDNKSITVKLADGSTKIVLINDQTIINKADTATIGDLTTGQKVAVFGTDNADGSVTAQNIQLNPIMRGLGGDSGPNPSSQ